MNVQPMKTDPCWGATSWVALNVTPPFKQPLGPRLVLLCRACTCHLLAAVTKEITPHNPHMHSCSAGSPSPIISDPFKPGKPASWLSMEPSHPRWGSISFRILDDDKCDKGWEQYVAEVFGLRLVVAPPPPVDSWVRCLPFLPRWMPQIIISTELTRHSNERSNVDSLDFANAYYSDSDTRGDESCCNNLRVWSSHRDRVPTWL